MRIFISYRRRGETGFVARLADRLAQAEGVSQVFRDADRLRPAMNFQTQILSALEQADVMIAAIGHDWVGRRLWFRSRLGDPADWVRRELEHALARGIPIVPVLLGDAVLPAASRLPASLQGLLSIQAARLRDESWEADLDTLLAALRQIQPDSQAGRQWPEPRPVDPSPGRPWVLGAAAAAVLVAGVALALWQPWQRGNDAVPVGPGGAGLPMAAPTEDPSRWTPPEPGAARSLTAALALRLALTEMQASTREASGQNDGFTVAKFTQRFPVGSTPVPWSIAFVGWCYLDALRRHRNDGAATLPFTDSMSYQALFAGLKQKGWVVQPFDAAQARPGDP